MHYYQIIEMWGNVSIATERFTFVWGLLFDLAQQLRDPHFVMAVSAILTQTIFYMAVKKIMVSPQRISDAMTIYALWPFFYLASFSIIRQALAVAIGLWVFYCAINRKPLLFAILLVANFFIHPSSIVCALFFVFFLPDFKLKIGQIFLVVVAFIALSQSLNYLLNNGYLGIYQVYLSHTDNFGSKLSVLMGVMLIPTLLLKYKGYRLDMKHSSGVLDVVVVAFIITILVYVVLSNSFMSRIMDYFLIMLVFVAPDFASLFSDKKIGRAIVYGAFLGVFIVYLLITADAQASSPYVPYKCILFRSLY